jgi:phosphoribosyl 1,2-cyclic phosphate phosphodiesterase
MDIEFLGTAASEGMPALFCECEVCQETTKRGGKNIRTRSSLMIGEKHKVDLPPDTFLHALRRGKGFSEVEHLFITHSHADHFYAEALRLRVPPFAVIPSGRTLCIHGTNTVEDLAKRTLGSPLPEQLSFHRVELFSFFSAGDVDVLPIRASHKSDELCLNYVFMFPGKGLLQAFDTGWYEEATWSALRGLMLDAAIIECTAGQLEEPPTSHLGIDALMQMKERLVDERGLRPNAQVIATHFSHIGGLLHKELQDALAPAGIEVAYDGMVLQI